MLITQALKTIRPAWLSRVSHRLARGQGLRENFLPQLDAFLDCLSQAVETGDPAWLDPLLADWAGARTFFDVEEQESSLSPLLYQMLQFMVEISREMLDEGDALALVDAVLPAYTHAFEYLNQRETALRVSYIQNELQRVRTSLEQLDRSKSDFISIAAHELKTPLTLIEGYTSMLGDLVADKDGSDGSSLLLDGIHSGTRRLREIIDDMIDVSKIDNQLLSLNFQPVWLHHILDAIQRDLEPVVTSRQLNLVVHPFPGSREMIFADLERLQQVFHKVISNAIKYTPDGGNIEVDGRILPGFIEITVQDSGIGIDPEDQERIFIKFGTLSRVSLHSSGKTKFKGGGPGLGLPIAKGIIEAHGGTIWVESQGNDEKTMPGSCFHIMLPVRKDPPDHKMATLFGSAYEREINETENKDMLPGI